MKMVMRLVVALTLVVSGLGGGVAFGQVSRVGTSVGLGGLVPSRHSDVVYDSVNDVYLMLSYGTPGGLNRSFARFVSAAGVPTSANVFGITTSGVEAARPRAAFGRDQFLVTWFDWRATKNGQVYARFLRYDPATGAASLGPEFAIATAVGFLNPETSTAAVAYSSVDDEFLVTWQEVSGAPLHDIRAQRVSASGALVGGKINITFDNHYQADPAVAYDRNANTFYVAWANYNEPSGPAGVLGRRVQSGTGALLDTQAQLLFTAAGTWLPVVVNNPTAGNFFVGWYTNSPSPTHYGALVGTNGSIVAPASPVVVNYPSYDGFDVAHNALTNTYFAVFHSRNPRPPFEVVGQELLPTARPTTQPEFEVTGTGAQRGTYYPSIASSARAREWLTTAALEFTSIVGQRIQSVTDGGGGGVPPPPPPPPPPPSNDPTFIDVVNAPNGSEYFAEGYASNDGLSFNTYYQLQNATNTPATVRAYFARQTSDGSVVLKERQIPVPANSRKTYDLKAELGLGPWSAVFQSLTPGVPITTQQSVFWGADFEGSSTATGARSAATQWLFAEGTRVNNDFFRNFFLLFNPGTTSIQVKGEFFGTGSGAPVEHIYTLPPASRSTIDGNEQVPGLANQDFSARFTSLDQASPFVAQRAMYWGQDYVGGHSSMGTRAAQPTWMFAEGVTAPAFDTFFTLLNPNPFPVDVNVTYLREVGGPVARSEPFPLPANSRRTIHANAELGNIGGFGATFNTIGGHGIVVERSIYWGSGGFNWVEGTNDMGVNAPAMTWALPEGSDAGLFDTYVLVANPNAFPVNVLVQFFLEGGGRITVPPFQVAAGKRLTVDMNVPRFALPTLAQADADLLRGKSFAVRVTSQTPNGPILVEGAIYRNWQDSTRWRAGASSFGVPQ